MSLDDEPKFVDELKQLFLETTIWASEVDCINGIFIVFCLLDISFSSVCV